MERRTIRAEPGKLGSKGGEDWKHFWKFAEN